VLATKEPRPADPLLSIVVPVFNEESMSVIFLREIRPVLQDADLRFQIIFVDDGSTDQTLNKLIELSESDASIQVISFSRNFGKEAALTAGIDFAQGDVVIPMDVDLQDPPELIPQFISKWREGYDVVYGLRVSRASDTVIKRRTAGLFYRFFNHVSEVQLPENAGDFRLMDRSVVEVLKKLPERNRFMKGLFSWAGFSSIGVPYERQARQADITKWNYWKLWNFALDGVVGFSTAPLRIWAYIGAFVAILAFGYGSFIILRVLMLGSDVPGYASLMTAILFLGGIQLLSMGVLGEYLGRLFIEVKARPIYVIDRVYKNGRSLPKGVID
jgi:glycosyltransferase involved in cell wall biosynthesis